MRVAGLLCLVFGGSLPEAGLAAPSSSSPYPPNAFLKSKIEFKRYGNMAESHQHLETALGDTLGVRMVKDPNVGETCTDEFSKFRYVSKRNLKQVVDDAIHYQICERPPKGEQMDIGKWHISTKLTCNGSYKYFRLDCMYTDPQNRTAPPFFASRMGIVPGNAAVSGQGKWRMRLNDLVGAKGSGQYFHNRIRCDKENQSNELVECEFLLTKFLLLEKAMCDADHCSAGVQPAAAAKALTASGAESAAPPAAASAQADEAAASEGGAAGVKKDEGMSPTTIGLIAGGGVLAIALGFGVVKMMGGGEAASAGSSGERGGRKGRKGARSGSSKHHHRRGSARESGGNDGGEEERQEIEEIEPDAEAGEIQEQEPLR